MQAENLLKKLSNYGTLIQQYLKERLVERVELSKNSKSFKASTQSRVVAKNDWDKTKVPIAFNASSEFG